MAEQAKPEHPPESEKPTSETIQRKKRQRKRSVDNTSREPPSEHVSPPRKVVPETNGKSRDDWNDSELSDETTKEVPNKQEPAETFGRKTQKKMKLYFKVFSRGDDN